MALKSTRFFERMRPRRVTRPRRRMARRGGPASELFGVGVGLVGLSIGLAAVSSVT